VDARPALPQTDATSGNERMMRSCICINSAALVTEMPGKVVGMYNGVPSLRFGMNSVPSLGTMPSIALAGAGRRALHRRGTQCFGRAMDDLDAGTDQHMLGGGGRYTVTKLQRGK